MSALRLQRTAVGGVMSTDVVSVGPDTPFERVARLLIDRRVRAVPVLDTAGEVISSQAVSGSASSARHHQRSRAIGSSGPRRSATRARSACETTPTT